MSFSSRPSARLFLALGALCAVGGLGCGTGRLTGCAKDRDCPFPQTCEGFVCVNSGCGVGAPTCVDDSACQVDQRCSSGCCVAGTPGTCVHDADCEGRTGTPVCDAASASCVPCLINSDCGAGRLCQRKTCVGQPGCYSSPDCKDSAKPLCNVGARTCVQCLSADDCSEPTMPNCDATNTCVGNKRCARDADCAKPTPRCEASSGACVTCLSSADCTSGFVCGPQHTCVVPSATTCTVDADCASNLDAPHCKPGTTTTPGLCVACTLPEHCEPGDTCAADFSCAPQTCTKDLDCVNPASPRCELTSATCVACLVSGDCPGGGACQADHTCQAPESACTQDDDCASNVSAPHCQVVTGGGNQCVACRNQGECGAAVTCPNDCGAQGLCTASNTCVSIACAGDPDCTQPSRSHCKGGGATATGVCVQCTSGAQCASGEKCANDACVAVCTAATAAADCPVATPKCRESPTGNACVQCLSNANCSGATPVCSATNTCIPTPPTCTSDASCPAGAKKCDTSASPARCVQCLSTPDCASGDVCELSTKTCQPLPVGSEGNPCRVDFSCDAGNLCVDEGGALPICRKLCEPTAAGNPCASVNAAYVCEWYGFDDADAFYGFCEPKNGHAALGAACDPRLVDSCEWNFFCAPKSASTGVCASVCEPGASCPTGACNAIVGALSFSGAALQFGYCGTASKWGKACITDTGSGAAAPGVPDCGDPLARGGNGGLFCAPSTLPAEVPAVNVAPICLYTPGAATATGGANDSCTTRGGNDCRTGVCLPGTATCYAGCRYNADCARDGGAYCFDVEFSTDDGASTLGTCEPTCRVDSDCPTTGSGRSCQPTPTHGGSSWQAVCGTVAGAGKAGAKCTSGAECASDVCLTASTLQGIAFGSGLSGFTATDGFCLGSCTTATDCTGAGTSCRIDAALPLEPLDTGDQGVMGKPNPGICFGTTCSTDANCAGFSADATTQRVCAPYKVAKGASTDNAKKCTADSDCAGSTSWQPLCNTTANNPNSSGVYGANAGLWGPNGRCRALTWAMQCAPALGKTKGGPGATCVSGTDCKTGHCVTLGAKNYCFGGCALDSDCATGTVCRTGNYLGLPDKHCAP